MKTNKEYINYEDLNTPIHAELNDYREERKIMREELSEGKEDFAKELKDMGNDIKQTLAINEAKARKTAAKKKKGGFSVKIKGFLDRLSRICK